MSKIWQSKNQRYSRTGWLVKTLHHQPSQQQMLRTAMMPRVNAFMQQQGKQQSQIQLFKHLLKHQIDKANTQIHNKPAYQLWQLFSFLFTPIKLPSEMIIVMFYKYQKLSLDGFNKIDPKQVDTEVVHSIVAKAIFQSVAYGASYLQDSITQLQLAFSKQDTGIWGAIKNLWKGDKGAQANFLLTINGLRVYGQFVIDCHYVKSMGVPIQIQGIQLYHLYGIPLNFRFVNGGIVIYLNVNNKLTLIPQPQFNTKFLQGILKGQLAQRTTNIIKAFNAYMQPTSSDQPKKRQFIQKYIQKNTKLI